MTTPPALFHAFLRPAILQILRATGYHSTRPAVLDSLTDLAARYLSALCENTARHAAHNHGQSGDFTVSDIRIALQDVGAFAIERTFTEDMWRGEEDLRGVEGFIRWFSGQRMKELMEVGNAEGESEATDYLTALKKKHNKTGDDAKYHGTILGRFTEGNAVLVEGGPVTSISDWISHRTPKPTGLQHNGNGNGNGEGIGAEGYDGERPSSPLSSASSGLSSVGDRLEEADTTMNGDAIAMEITNGSMDLT